MLAGIVRVMVPLAARGLHVVVPAALCTSLWTTLVAPVALIVVLSVAPSLLLFPSENTEAKRQVGAEFDANVMSSTRCSKSKFGLTRVIPSTHGLCLSRVVQSGC